MASPMEIPGVCCLCWGPHDGEVWAIDDAGLPLVRVNVCGPCRTAEIRRLIMFRAAWEG